MLSTLALAAPFLNRLALSSIVTVVTFMLFDKASDAFLFFYLFCIFLATIVVALEKRQNFLELSTQVIEDPAPDGAGISCLMLIGAIIISMIWTFVVTVIATVETVSPQNLFICFLVFLSLFFLAGEYFKGIEKQKNDWS